MKKLIGLLMIMLFSANTFGQMAYGRTELSSQLYFRYSLRSQFTYNGKEYAIAQDSVWIETTFNPHQKKDVYLWRKDGNNWTIVTDALRTDYAIYENGVTRYDCWVDNPRNTIHDLNELFGKDKNIGYSSVETKNGIIYITMLSFTGFWFNDDFEVHSEEIMLLPKDDGTFSIWKQKSATKQ